MAEEEEQQEAGQGSPSPAPRLWRSRPGSSDGHVQKAKGLGPRRRIVKSGALVREDTASSIESAGTPIRKSDVSETDFDERLRQHALERGSSEDLSRRSSGLFSKSRLGVKISETAKELVRKSSRNSLEGDSPSRAAKSTTNNGWLSRRLSARKSRSEQSLPQGASPTERPSLGSSEEQILPGGDSLQRPSTVPPVHRSPEKSFAWQAEEDFTAGDLQVSSSPPVGTGRSNTKIDEIRALEADLGKTLSVSPQPVTRNPRIDEIRALEIETASKIKNEPLHPGENDNVMQELGAERGDKLHSSWQPGPATTRRDDIRVREMETLSKRALATARLDEIRERHANSQSRSPSPELVRKASKELLSTFSPSGGGSGEAGRGSDNVPAADSKPLIDEAVVLETSANEKDSQDRDIEGVQSEEVGGDLISGRLIPETKKDSRDVLRRLALAANSSPPTAEPRVPSDNISARDRLGRETSRQKKVDAVKVDARPTVGFVGLKRESSAESLSDKRSNFAHSDSDPTERIEGEMQLFAPLENHSEKGSLRAPSPSPSPEADDVEETPRPAKPDPLTQPTPRVTGAFVDTPLTVKPGRSGRLPIVAVPTLRVEGHTGTASSSDPLIRDNDVNPLFRGRKTCGSAQNLRHGLPAKDDRVPGRPSSVPGRRRSKSLPRAHSTLLNSARPPTVKDDLLEIQRANHFEDSTLDDLADLLGNQDNDEDDSVRRGAQSEPGTTSLLERKRELEAYDRMSKSLTTGLLGIRSAKQGIERLEDKVSHVGPKGSETDTADPLNPTAERSCQNCHDSASPTGSSFTYIQLPFPRLWHGRPRFRLTFIGLVLFLLSLWYIAESAMCALYCKPQVCYPGQTCDWSPDDPRWGYSIPIKLDQWLTGGHGKAFAAHARPELADWLADIWDAATGTDITRIDISRYSREQKRQHRRRLLKGGLANPSVRLEDKAKFDAWSAARVAKEKASGAREMGYAVDDDETMAADEKL